MRVTFDDTEDGEGALHRTASVQAGHGRDDGFEAGCRGEFGGGGRVMARHDGRDHRRVPRQLTEDRRPDAEVGGPPRDLGLDVAIDAEELGPCTRDPHHVASPVHVDAEVLVGDPSVEGRHGELAVLPTAHLAHERGDLVHVHAVMLWSRTDAISYDAAVVMKGTVDGIGPEEHRALARATNARAWELLESTRTPAEDFELVHVAHTSLWHWLQIGEPVNEQRGEWLVSHVYAVLGRPEPTLVHAQRCWDITEAEQLGGFDRAYACEAIARAAAVSGDTAGATAWRERATAAAATITDPEDRQIFDADFAAGPW